MKNIKIELKLNLIYFTATFFLMLFSCTSNEFKEVKQSKPKTSKELANRSEPSLTNVDSTSETKVIPQVLPIVIPPIVPLPDPLPDPEPPYPDPYPFSDPEPPLELPEPEILKDTIVLFPEIIAEFPGGSQSLKDFISQNIIFPQLCKENNIEGRVFVKFLVHSTGGISQIQIARGVHPQLDFEAKNVVKKMPLWNPAIFQGRKVPSYAVIPVLFKIE
jgi:TonB family protein